MAKGRMVNRTVAHDDRLAQLSLPAELLFLHTLPFLDRDGKILGYPSNLRGQVVPVRAEREGWSDEDITRLMLEWTATVDQDGHPDPLVFWYDGGGVPVCLFRGFRKNQTLKPTEPKSVLPDPPDDLLHGASLNPQPPLQALSGRTGPHLRDHMPLVWGPVSEEKRIEVIDQTSSGRDGQLGNASQPGNDGQLPDGALTAPRLSEPPQHSPSAQQLVSRYVDLARERGVAKVPDRVLGQLGRELKRLLDEGGHPPEAIEAALHVLLDRALGPSQLASCVQQVQLEASRHTRPRREVRSGTDLSAYVRA